MKEERKKTEKERKKEGRENERKKSERREKEDRKKRRRKRGEKTKDRRKREREGKKMEREREGRGIDKIVKPATAATKVSLSTRRARFRTRTTGVRQIRRRPDGRTTQRTSALSTLPPMGTPSTP